MSSNTDFLNILHNSFVNSDSTWTYTTTDTWDQYLSGSPITPKHFNCKRCGAPNQIDVCEY